MVAAAIARAARCRDREDFVQLVMEHGEHLPGKAGNYRIAKFPGTERILFKTNFSKAFKDKDWYPKTFILPEEKARLMMCPKQYVYQKSAGVELIQIWPGRNCTFKYG